MSGAMHRGRHFIGKVSGGQLLQYVFSVSVGTMLGCGLWDGL